jgi:hypothetical protein
MSTLSSVPLLGALCVAAGLVTHEEAEECFALQHTSYPGTPIGQILVIKGYLTQLELARMVAQQQNFRRVFCTTLDNQLAQAGGEHSTPAAEVPAAVPELASFTAADLETSPLFGASR